MKVQILFFIVFLALNCKAGGVIAIHEESDIDRVKNNVSDFWERHLDLFELISKNESIPNSKLKEIENDKTCITRDYKRSSSTFIKELKGTISYVKDHFPEVEELLGEKDAYGFKQFLFALTHLVKKLPRHK